jgi:ABC-2 type transport system ATP-binding protein
MKPIISVKNLSKTYEYARRAPGFRAALRSFFVRKKLYKKAVKNISFDIQEGELVGFLGPNGAGKTTTLKMLSGILYPTSGKISVLGHEPAKRNHEMQKQFALVMGNKNQLWWDLPSTDTFLLNKEIYGLSNAEYTKNLHELSEMLDVGSTLDIPVRKLSLGQRMKCELIACLLHNPKVLLLDEPTLGLDVVAQKNIREFIRYYNQTKKTTILLTSHYMDDIQELAKRVVVINLGEIIYDGTLELLISTYAPYKSLKLKSEKMRIKDSEVGKFGKVAHRDDLSLTLHVDRQNIKRIASAILSSSLPIDDIDISEPEVEDVIREVFQKGVKK